MVFWYLEGVLHDCVDHFLRRPSVEWSPVEQQLVRCYAQTPPIDAPRIALFAHDLRCHVRHASSDTRVHSTLRVVDRDIEVCYVGMARGVN